MTSHQLLRELSTAVSEMIGVTETQFLILDDADLVFRTEPNAWNIVQCFEHLNRYNRFYNAAIEKGIKSGRAGNDVPLRSSWIGRKSVAAMHPDNTKKQKTLRHLDPGPAILDRSVIMEFVSHQRVLLNLLDKARMADLNTIRIPVEFFRLLKMNLGDAFQFVVCHQQRHFQQLARIREALPKAAEVVLKV